MHTRIQTLTCSHTLTHTHKHALSHTPILTHTQNTLTGTHTHVPSHQSLPSSVSETFPALTMNGGKPCGGAVLLHITSNCAQPRPRGAGVQGRRGGVTRHLCPSCSLLGRRLAGPRPPPMCLPFPPDFELTQRQGRGGQRPWSITHVCLFTPCWPPPVGHGFCRQRARRFPGDRT